MNTQIASQEGAQVLSEEFTKEGIRAYVLSHLDEDSYSDESLYAIYSEFTNRLVVKIQELSQDMFGFGIKFSWNVNKGVAFYTPKDALEDYIFIDKKKNEWRGINAIVAFLREDVDVEQVADDHWNSWFGVRKWEYGFDEDLFFVA